MATLTLLVKAKVISNSMASKIAGNGLMLCHLRMAHLRNETDGIAKLFAEACNGKPRVTKSKTVVEKVQNFLREKH